MAEAFGKSIQKLLGMGSHGAGRVFNWPGRSHRIGGLEVVIVSSLPSTRMGSNPNPNPNHPSKQPEFEYRGACLNSEKVLVQTCVLTNPDTYPRPLNGCVSLPIHETLKPKYSCWFLPTPARYRQKMTHRMRMLQPKILEVFRGGLPIYPLQGFKPSKQPNHTTN